MLRAAAYHRTVSEYLYTGSEIFRNPTLKHINLVNPIQVREYMDVSSDIMDMWTTSCKTVRVRLVRHQSFLQRRITTREILILNIQELGSVDYIRHSKYKTNNPASSQITWNWKMKNPFVNIQVTKIQGEVQRQRPSQGQSKENVF